MAETRIIKEVSFSEYLEFLDKYKDKIKINSHAYFRLSEMQRKVYKDEALIKMLTEEKPAFIGIQKNQNYALFFSTKKGYLRIILKITNQYLELITFYITDHVPRI